MKQIIYILSLICVFNTTCVGQIKTVTLTTTGQGETQDIAKQNALRNAIEQTFGTFISSHTEIVNDNLVKDEIITLSNGNIQKYEILAEKKLANGLFSSILSVTVSTIKLKTYCKNKGVEIEYDGDTFAANFKLMEFYKKNEEKLLFEITEQFNSILKNSYSFELKTGDPRRQNSSENKFEIPIQIEAKLSDIVYEDIKRILRNTIKSISLPLDDKNFYEKSNINFFIIKWVDKENDDQFILRSKKSEELLIKFLKSIPDKSCYFSICNDLFSIDGENLKKNNSKIQNYNKKVYFKFFSESKVAPKGYIKLLDFELNEKNFEENYLIKNKKTELKRNKDYYDYFDALRFERSKRIGNYIIYNFNIILKIDELEKIKKFTIKPNISSQNSTIEQIKNVNKVEIKNEPKTIEINPKFKIGDWVRFIYVDKEFENEDRGGILTIYQVIKIENKYFYKIKDEINNVLFNKLIPEEILGNDAGG